MKSLKICVSIILMAIMAVPVWASSAGKITAVEGRVDITRDGKDAVAAVAGAEVFVGDVIRTKSASRAEILFVDGSKLRIAEKTRLKIDEYMFREEETSGILTLFRGKVLSLVKKTKAVFGKDDRNKFEVRAGTAVVGVRGTEFITYRRPNVSGAIFTEGEGYCYSVNLPEAVRLIRAGQAMQVSDPFKPPEIRVSSEIEIQTHMRDTAPIEAEGEVTEKTADPPDSKTAGIGPDAETGPGAAETGEAGGKGRPAMTGEGMDMDMGFIAAVEAGAPEGGRVSRVVIETTDVEIPFDGYAVVTRESDVVCDNLIEEDFSPDQLETYVNGLFDPVEHTYRTAETWTETEIRAFLYAAADSEGQALLSDVNVPYVEIGKTDLAGSSQALSVNMNDVTFFSYSAGAAPEIWATGDVSGTWIAAPEIGHSVNLSGGGLNAGFDVTRWNDNQWGANVSGNGTLTRTDISGTSNIQFSGTANGKYSGTASGAFSGTAAGQAN